MTAAAHRRHFPLKVALIATPVDLGAIPSFFGKPKQYAAFLDQEISFAARVPLLVVMPGGYGDAELGGAGQAVVGSLAPASGHTSDALAEAAIVAVRKLAAAAGHPLGPASSSSTSSSTGGGGVLPLVILAAVCVLVAGAIIGIRLRRAAPPIRRR